MQLTISLFDKEELASEIERILLSKQMTYDQTLGFSLNFLEASLSLYLDREKFPEGEDLCWLEEILEILTVFFGKDKVEKSLSYIEA